MKILGLINKIISFPQDFSKWNKLKGVIDTLIKISNPKLIQLLVHGLNGCNP